MPPRRSLTVANLVVRLAAPLVPRAQRDDWRAEWLAELSAHADSAAHASTGDAGARSLIAHALGAPIDGLWMRQRAVVDAAWIDDLRHGSRQFRQQTGFALTAIGILAVGIAACVTAFSIVSQTLLRPLPYPQPDRIVTVWERRANDTVPMDVAPGNFLDWRERATSFAHLAAADPYSRDYTGGDRPEVLRGSNVTEGFFDVFGLQPLHGRFFRTEEHRKGAAPVAVLSAALWRSLFAGDPAIVGRSILLNEQPFTVIGITPDDFEPHLFPDRFGNIGIWVPKAIEEYEPRIRLGGYFVARTALAPQLLLEPAKAAIWAIDPLQTFYRTATLDELVGRTVATRRFALVVMTGFATIALLLAAAGLYGVLTAIVSQYRREIGVRMALGAEWIDIVRLVVARGLAVAAAGVGVGLAGVLGLARVLDAFLFSVAPRDPATILASVLLMLAVSALACFVPARRAASASPAEVLRIE